MLEGPAVHLRERLGIPALGANGRSANFDGWWVTGGGARYISMVRQSDERGHHLLAEAVVDLLHESRRRDHLQESVAALRRAGNAFADTALIAAIGAREHGPSRLFSLSRMPSCSYHGGGLDNAYGQRRRLRLPREVRRRTTRAYDVPPEASDPEPNEYFEHRNESGHVIEPAYIRGRDALVWYGATIARSSRQLRAQMSNVFGVDAGAREGMSSDARRAWTQLSFGRGGGGGLVRALRHVRDSGGTMEAIFSDPVLVAHDSVKRARVTAADAALIQRFGLTPQEQFGCELPGWG